MLSKDSIIQSFNHRLETTRVTSYDEKRLYNLFVCSLEIINQRIKNKKYKILQVMINQNSVTRFSVKYTEYKANEYNEVKGDSFELLFYGEEPNEHLHLSRNGKIVKVNLLKESNDDCKLINYWFLLVLYAYLLDENEEFVFEKLNNFVSKKE